MMASAGALAMFNNPIPAFAEDIVQQVKSAMPQGQVSYSTFLQGVSDHTIERVRVAADGRQAEFLN